MEADTGSGAPVLASATREVRDGRTTVVLVREFPHSREAVWTAITDPEFLRLWSPYTADRDLSSVGKVMFTMLGDSGSGSDDVDVACVVLIADRPVALEHSWATDVLAWRLDATESGCRLTLRHTLADPAMASASAAGWHLCFDVADATLAGEPTEPVRGMAAMNHGWSDLNERYATVLGVEPSRI